jgi:hypothetical protein
MNTVKVKTTTENPVKFLRAECGVRYWEDAKVNGMADGDGDMIPRGGHPRTGSVVRSRRRAALRGRQPYVGDAPRTVWLDAG